MPREQSGLTGTCSRLASASIYPRPAGYRPDQPQRLLYCHEPGLRKASEPVLIPLFILTLPLDVSIAQECSLQVGDRFPTVAKENESYAAD